MSMKALLLDGAREGDGPALAALREIVVRELEDRGWQVQAMRLREMDIAPCLGCFGCWTKTPGSCLQDDAGCEVLRATARSELVIYLTPVVFGGYSPELKKALDRSVAFLLPFFKKIHGETHHELRYGHGFRLVAVGVLGEANEEAEQLFLTLARRNALNVHPPAYAAGVVLSGQGAEEMREKVRGLLARAEVAG
jgi:multimeric flavodoxin WrbA